MSGRDDDAVNIKGSAPGGVGLLLVDVINPLDFDGADQLAPAALKAAEVIARLRAQADEAGTPVIYVNDNYGHWGSEKTKLVEQCAAATPEGAKLVTMLRPRDHDFFVIKPQVSGFYATNLPVLLPKLGVSRVVVTGFATDICILFTAADAHMREYDIWTPQDAVAGEKPERSAWALDILRKTMGVRIDPTDELDLKSWICNSRAEILADRDRLGLGG